jgi:Lon protease-like protein
MTLPSATLFPQALLPLYIFEPRYRKMLADTLETHRMLCVAMQEPGSNRETPLPVAGLGLIRVCVGHKDGTSHLVLQGIGRVELEKVVRYKPYRVQKIHPLSIPPCDTAATDALMAKVRELIQERFNLGLPFPFLPKPISGNLTNATPQISAKEIVGYLDSIDSPSQAADLVSCAVLPDAEERQAILEALDVETRLRRLIQFMIQEIRQHRKGQA